MAEEEVFRRMSNRMNWEQLSAEQKEAYRQQGVVVTKRRVRDRYAALLKENSTQIGSLY